MIAGLDGVLWQRQRREPELTHQDLLREAVGAFLVAAKRRARASRRG